MRKFLLIHEGQRILLPEGRTLLGRGLACNIRFNDPAVSREHLTIDVSHDRAVAANLSKNGTCHNGLRMDTPTLLTDGDELSLGHRIIVLETVEESSADRSVSVETETPLAEAEEATQPGGLDEWEEKHVAALPVDASALADIRVHSCPRCRTVKPYLEDTCTSCGYQWPLGHPSSVTQEIKIDVNRRRDPRYGVEIPVIYSSATLTIDATIRNLSRGGMFVATELLDPIGTPCDITVLPDGHAALQFHGSVVRVANGRPQSGPAGLGIQFLGGSKEAMAWLGQTLVRYEGAD